MIIDIITIFPEMFEGFKQTSIIKRSLEKGVVKINTHNFRDYTLDKHNKVDDTPYGGGAGMLMKPDVVYDAYKSLETEKSKVIYLSPQGKRLTQEKVEELAKETHLILLCGHYEGIDQRVIDKIAPEEISIGDYVLTGGEIPAMVLIDSVSRYTQGVLNNESIKDESFSNGISIKTKYTTIRHNIVTIALKAFFEFLSSYTLNKRNPTPRSNTKARENVQQRAIKITMLSHFLRLILSATRNSAPNVPTNPGSLYIPQSLLTAPPKLTSMVDKP
jgi:tRNA (guanine37-N1)-methyltransferase